MRRTFLIALIFAFLGAQPAFSGAQEDAGRTEPDFTDIQVLSLDECVLFALQNAFEVKMAKLDLMIAETDKLYAEAVFDTFLFGNVYYVEDKRQQASVFAGDDSQTNYYSWGVRKELPTGTELTAEWSDTRNWTNTIFQEPNPYHNAELMLQFSQPVGKNFFGYVDRTNVSVTELAIKNADLATRDRIEAFIADVEKAYWRVVFQKRTMELRRGILERAERLHEVNRKNYDLGLIEKGDFLASEANVVIRETDMLVAENNYKAAEDELKLLMNMPEEYRILPSAAFVRERFQYNLVDCLKTAFGNRRDYKIKKRDVKIRDLTLKMKDNEKWPEVDLVGSMIMNGLEGDFEKAFGKTTVVDNVYYYAGVEVTLPVENSQARSEAKKAGFEKEKAIVSLKETERTIITQVGVSFRDVMTYNESSENMEQAVKLQRGKLDEEEKRFKFGRSSTKRLIDYQQDLLNAEMSEAIELLARENARVDLERDMNVLLGKYEERV